MIRLRQQLLAALALAVLASPATAQELEPRLYANVPVGVNFVAMGYGYSTGNILLDTTLPLEDLQADVHTGIVRYIRTLDVGGKSGKLDVFLPHTWGTWSAVLDGEPASTSRTGFGDPRIRFSVNFLGAPAMDRQAFRGFRPKTIVGASLQVYLPLGEYDSTDIINLGSNRWTFRPQIGFSRAVKKWTFELSADAWFFTDNDDYLNGQRLEQSPIYALQLHVLYAFRPGLWLGLDAAVASGGRTEVDGVFRNELEENTRVGITLAVPLNPRNGLSFSFARGITTRVGADFDNYVVAWQIMWGGKPQG